MSGYLREQRRCHSLVTEGWSWSQRPSMQPSQSLWRKLSLLRTNLWWCNMRSICRMARSVVGLTSRWGHCTCHWISHKHVCISNYLSLHIFISFYSTTRVSTSKKCRENNWITSFAAPDCQRRWDWLEELQWQDTIHYNVWAWQVWQWLQVTLHF